MIQKYNEMLIKRPLATKMATAFCVGSTGDTICQFLEHYYKRKYNNDSSSMRWDPVRTCRQGTVASMFMSSTTHVYLTRLVPKLTFKKGTFSTVKMTTYAHFALRYLTHLFIFMPAHQALFFVAMGLVRHQSLDKGFELFRENWFEGMKLAYCYYPPIVIGLYTFVPTRYGNLYNDSFALIWHVFLSYLANRKKYLN